MSVAEIRERMTSTVPATAQSEAKVTACISRFRMSLGDADIVVEEAREAIVCREI